MGPFPVARMRSVTAVSPRTGISSSTIVSGCHAFIIPVRITGVIDAFKKEVRIISHEVCDPPGDRIVSAGDDPGNSGYGHTVDRKPGRDDTQLVPLRRLREMQVRIIGKNHGAGFRSSRSDGPCVAPSRGERSSEIREVLLRGGKVPPQGARVMAPFFGRNLRRQPTGDTTGVFAPRYPGPNVQSTRRM